MDYLKLARRLLRGGDRHSDVYVDGMIAALRLRIDGEPTVIDYPQGSLEFDAYYYGCRRGADEFRNALIEANGKREQALASLQQLADGERRVA
ncbi:hypothetical protein [Stutzerimonas stutzeri]|uniref:hypothetical protein n=1 Tax=Stutzerimonas stutzeri TaxID=316 RepID=UPI001BCC8ACA|nr:hypothetical protein [Stutzerimonas stutzeri]